MKKRLIAVLAVLLLAGTVSVFASGIGVQGGVSVGSAFLGRGAVTFKFKLPWLFAVNVGGTKEHFSVGATMDRWLANPTLSSPINYFYGWGLAGYYDTATGAGVGARLVGGLNVFVAKAFEFYIQGAWQPMFLIGDYVGPDLLNFPVDVGFRFWF